jgi:3-hydroxyisobutyrate dehydrogenase-like beta-hydroxyacid dehydrogenase
MPLIDKTQTKIGFAGLGLMGSHLVHRLSDQGWNVRVWNRSPERAREFSDRHLTVEKTLSDLVGYSDVIMSSLANDQAVREVYLGEKGIFAHPKPGLIILEMSTVTPSVSEELHIKAQTLGIGFLDIPISGSTPAVKTGSITLLGGGSPEVFEDCVPLYESLAKQWFLMGPAGSGARMKLVANLLLGVGMEAIAESISLGESMGLRPETLLTVLSKLAVIGPAFVGKFERIQRNDYSPQFPLRLMDKDLGLVLKEAGDKNLFLPATEAAYQVTREVVKEKGDLDLSAVTPFVVETRRAQS